MRGVATYTVDITEETDQNGNKVPVSNGFTVHNFRIDEDTQSAYITVTNAQNWVKDTTTVQVVKQWNDREDHTYDAVGVYLTVTDPDGTVRRIREIQLSDANEWQYTWTNLPKYAQDGVTEIVYDVEEAYKSGYTSTVEKVEQIEIEQSMWAEAYEFANGRQYLLGTSSGYLSTTSATANTLKWVDETTAKSSSLALWTATVSSGKVRFTNQNGQILTFNYSSSSSSRYYHTSTSTNSTYQALTAVDTGNGFRFYCTRSNRNYYIGSLGSNGRATATTTANSGLVFTPMTLETKTTIQDVEDLAYKITNTPLEEETSVTVHKTWDLGMATDVDYQKALVTVKLLADGKDTGRTVTLSLKNGWTDTFRGLPYTDENDRPIVYTVEESWETNDWLPLYGEVTVKAGSPPTYETTVTNSYKWGHGYELPATGGFGRTPWILCGLSLMLGSLVVGCILRRKRERGSDG